MHVPTNFTLSSSCGGAHMCCSRKQQKNFMVQFMRGYSVFRLSIQFPSLMALESLLSLPYTQCGPDTTDLRVWELSVMVIQDSLLNPVRVKCTASHFTQRRKMTEWALKQSEPWSTPFTEKTANTFVMGLHNSYIFLLFGKHTLFWA